MSRLTKRYSGLYAATRNKPDEQERFWRDVKADFTKNNVTPRDFSIRDLFCEFVFDSHGDRCGRQIIESWLPEGNDGVSLMETGPGAVTTAAFTNITGQIVYNEILAKWNNPAFVSNRLARTVSTSFLDGEKIAGISAVADDAESIAEGQPYPLTGVTQEYVETQPPVKRGHILPLTRETIISDRTGVLLDRAGTIGQTMAMNKEKRVIDMAIGTTQTWSRNGSALTATYANSGAAPHDFDNLITNALVDWTDIDAALQIFDEFVDPNTGEPIVTQTTQVVVPSSLLGTMRRIVNATQIDHRTSSSTIVTYGPNPLLTPSLGGAASSVPLEIVTSPYVQSRIDANTGIADNTWWIGNFMEAFRYMEVWPMSVVPMPSNSMWEFQNDIVRAWKVSEFGVTAVIEPRHVLQCNAS